MVSNEYLKSRSRQHSDREPSQAIETCLHGRIHEDPAEDLNLDTSEIYMVGDNQSDIQAGVNAGCKGGILVKTANENVDSPNAIYTAPDLLDAVRYIVSNS